MIEMAWEVKMGRTRKGSRAARRGSERARTERRASAYNPVLKALRDRLYLEFPVGDGCDKDYAVYIAECGQDDLMDPEEFQDVRDHNESLLKGAFTRTTHEDGRDVIWHELPVDVPSNQFRAWRAHLAARVATDEWPMLEECRFIRYNEVTGAVMFHVRYKSLKAA